MHQKATHSCVNSDSAVPGFLLYFFFLFGEKLVSQRRKKSFFEHVELEFSLGTIKSLGKPGYIHELSSKVK